MASLATPMLFLVLLTLLSVSTCHAHKEATIRELRIAFNQNRVTSRQLVEFYLGEIKKLNPVLKGVLEVNPDALYEADRADKERAANMPQSLVGLHGIPVLLKDSIATKDKLNTTSGSFALLGSIVPRDAGIVSKLRKSGAIILGKASLSEWSNFRSLSAPSGWSPRGGQGKNPYVLSASPCGSSSGPAISVAANMAAVSIGTETDGSILCPASFNSVVGIKPTVGLTSRAGVIPVSPSLDTIGPICRTVSDAVYVLDTIVGFDYNDRDATRKASRYIPYGGYSQFLKLHGLKGKRIGVVRNPFFVFSKGSNLHQVFENHLQTLRKEGAILIDNLEIIGLRTIFNATASGEAAVAIAEFKIAINAYLKSLVASSVRSLTDVIAFNNKFSDLEKVKNFGQDIFLAAEATNGIGELEKAAITNMARLTREGYEKMMSENRLDAVVTTGANISPVLAIGGFPAISVPAAYDDKGVPLVLVSFSIAYCENYNSWSQAMQIALSVKNKTGFIDGSLPKPNVTEIINLDAWLRNNKLVIFWILNSVSKEISASIMFTETAYDIWNDLKDRFQQTDLCQELYVLDEKKEAKVCSISLDTWHTRLGHPSNKCLSPIRDLLSVKNTRTELSHCSVCPLAKQKQLPFVSVNNLENDCFALVHYDIWGPYSTTSIQGFRYFATIVDDHSRYTWIYMLKNKYDIISIIPSFYQMVLTQIDKKIKVFRFDNAKELEFKDFFSEKGIIHQKSCVAKPQQNSVVERKHQHLLNVARALSNRTKFCPRAKPCVFVGYPSNMKAYKLYDLAKHEFVISRDVVFHESIFPFKNIDSIQPATSFFDQFVIPVATNDEIPFNTQIPDISPDSHSFDHNPISGSSSDSNTSHPSPHQNPNIATNKPVRTRKPPSYLRDFHCNSIKHQRSTTYPLSDVLNYDKLSPNHKAFVMNLSANFEPQNFNQASKYPEWCNAMDDELNAIETNKTWTVMPLPPDKHTVGCRWVYKLKIVKTLLAIAAAKSWSLAQLDVNNAFLNGDLKEEVYMELPPGLKLPKEKYPSQISLACKLNKSIYGLRQASRQWFENFSSFMLILGFTQFKSDYSLFHKGSGSNYVALLVYVDDIIITGSSTKEINFLKK
ncbi:hypothetical protein LXL04_019678 [Taraxacum kok-saghyz]